jgi:macrolide transport system ATP-binding/permease protein
VSETLSSSDSSTRDDPALQLVSVGREYEGDPPTTTLREINLTIEHGEYVCIVGPSGSGKSSLLNQMGLLDRPSSGQVLVDGIDTGSLPEADRTRLRADQISFVFQEFHLLNHRTVLENVVLGMLYTVPDVRVRDERARVAIERVGLTHRISASPRTLSGGERQRVAIARAVANEPSILLCDEPTGNLDSTNSKSILRLLSELRGDRTTLVVITHDPTVAEAADRRITVRDGSIVGDDRRSDELTSAGLRVGRQPRDSTRGHHVSFTDLVTEAIASLSQRISRTLFTMIGAVLGIGAFVAVLGLNATAAGQVVSDFSITRATTVTVNEAGATEARDTVLSFPIDADGIANSMNGVVEAGLAWQLPTGGAVAVTTSLDPRADSKKIVVTAASPGYLRFLDPTLSSGRLYGSFHDDRHLPVAVLGEGAARDLNISTVRNQPTIFVQGTAFTVVGIIGDVVHDPSALSSIFIPEQIALDIFGEPLVETPAQMRIQTEVGAAEVVASQISLALRPDQPALLQVIPPAEPFEVESRVSGSLQTLFLLLAGVIVLIAAASIANVNLVSVLERTPEIGLRRAIGARPRDIARQIVLETGLTGLLGGLVGTAIAVCSVVITAAALSWTAILNPSITVLGPVLGAAIGLLAGWYPARQASRIEPIAALRR